MSVIIPAYNAQATIERALTSICAQNSPGPGGAGLEVIVVDDGSTDATVAICKRFPVTLIRLTENHGPARARNAGARVAAAGLLLFLDADTCLHPDGLARITAAFDADPQLDALIGAYDDQPAAPGMLSQYRNLLHCFVHRSARRQASTFWSGCGAIRTAVFLEYNGFDETYRRASIEDLELGYRLHHGGRKVVMDPLVQVKHLKHWTFRSMLKTDVRDRAVPWTQLILRERFMPADLNLGFAQRFSVVAVFAASLLAFVSAFSPRQHRLQLAAALLLLLAILLMNRAFYSFLYRRRGARFTAQAIPLHLLFYSYNGVSFVIGLACWIYSTHPMRALRRRLVQMVAG